MKIFYSKASGGFYNSAVNNVIPADKVEITRDEWLGLLDGQAAGRLIGSDDKGRPVLTDQVVDLVAIERKWRDAELALMIQLRDRHRDQLEIEVPSTLTDEQYRELLLFMQALRDWPQSPDFPTQEKRPVAPAWIDEQLK